MTPLLANSTEPTSRLIVHHRNCPSLNPCAVCTFSPVRLDWTFLSKDDDKLFAFVCLNENCSRYNKHTRPMRTKREAAESWNCANLK